MTVGIPGRESVACRMERLPPSIFRPAPATREDVLMQPIQREQRQEQGGLIWFAKTPRQRTKSPFESHDRTAHYGSGLPLVTVDPDVQSPAGPR